MHVLINEVFVGYGALLVCYLAEKGVAAWFLMRRAGSENGASKVGVRKGYIALAVEGQVVDKWGALHGDLSAELVDKVIEHVLPVLQRSPQWYCDKGRVDSSEAAWAYESRAIFQTALEGGFESGPDCSCEARLLCDQCELRVDEQNVLAENVFAEDAKDEFPVEWNTEEWWAAAAELARTGASTRVVLHGQRAQ